MGADRAAGAGRFAESGQVMNSMWGRLRVHRLSGSIAERTGRVDTRWLELWEGSCPNPRAMNPNSAGADSYQEITEALLALARAEVGHGV